MGQIEIEVTADVLKMVKQLAAETWAAHNVYTKTVVY